MDSLPALPGAVHASAPQRSPSFADRRFLTDAQVRLAARRAGAGEAGLGKDTDLLSTPRTRAVAAARIVRSRRLRTARKVVPHTRMASCMWSVAHERQVQVVLSPDNVAGYAGVMRCGLRSCPWCAAAEARDDYHRACRVAQSWVDAGSLLVMVAYTMRHTVDEPLSVTRAAFVDAQQRLHAGRPWRAFVESRGVGERFYGNELTDGVNGWHFHRHVVYQMARPSGVLDRPARKALRRSLKRELTVQWLQALENAGRVVKWDRAELRRAVVVSVVAGDVERPELAASYVTKFALEATHSVTKDGRLGGRSPWQLLDDADNRALTAAQRARARARFREFVDATRGMHWTWFSAGCGVGPNESEKPWSDDPGVSVLDVSGYQWRCLRFFNRQVWLLDLVERSGVDAAVAELRRFCDGQRWSQRFRRGELAGESPGGELMDAVAF